jgi:PilZ domain-containing protein
MKFDNLSSEIKDEIQKYHSINNSDDDSIIFEDSIVKWFNEEFDNWLGKKSNNSSIVTNRKFFRLDVELPITIVDTICESGEDEEDKKIIGDLINISKGGLYFKSKVDLKISTIIKVNIDLSNNENKIDNIEALAMIVRSDKIDNNFYGIGVMFSSIYDSDQKNLDHLILKKLAFHLHIDTKD